MLGFQVFSCFVILYKETDFLVGFKLGLAWVVRNSQSGAKYVLKCILILLCYFPRVSQLAQGCVVLLCKVF